MGRTGTHTVTRLDMIFRYPDRVPLTHFVHRDKKSFWHLGLIFLLSFLRHRNFPVLQRKSSWAQGGREPLTFRLRNRCSTTAPLLPCICEAITFMCSLQGFSGRFCSYRKPNFPAVSGSYLPGFSGRICSYWSRIFRPYQVVTCQEFLALPFLAPEGRDFPAVSVVSGRNFPAVAFWHG
jgi:hypothetical protein